MPDAPQPGPPEGRPARRPRSAVTRPNAVVVLLLAVAVVAFGATACGTSGRTLRDPIPGATAPPRKPSATTPPAAINSVPVGLSISSSAWVPGGTIPALYTCDGQNVSPPLTISGAPADTAELVLEVTDQDASDVVHWVVAGIPTGLPAFPQGGLPSGAVEAPNSSGSTAWYGPCPPAGAAHTYDFTVYALATPSGLGSSSTPAQLEAVTAEATSTAAMTASYTRA